MPTFAVHLSVVVEVTVNDDDVITRVLDNHDDQGRPQPIGSGNGWQDYLYKLGSRDEVLHMLAYNCVANGVNDANRLDGWADLERDVATMRVDSADLDFVDHKGPRSDASRASVVS